MKQAAAAHARTEVGAGVALVALVGLAVLVATKMTTASPVLLVAEPALAIASETTALQM